MINNHLNITLDNSQKRAPISLGARLLRFWQVLYKDELFTPYTRHCRFKHTRVLFILSHIVKKDKRTRICPLSFAWH